MSMQQISQQQQQQQKEQAPKVYHSLFCQVCGNLLDLPNAFNEWIQCSQCLNSIAASTFENKKNISKSRKSLKQSSYNHNGSLDTGIDENSGAIIEERCEKCGHDKMKFFTMQLRSADEGQTVFYTCLKCKYTYSLNS
ncbi:hypothetical protein MP228_001932 [Amoeboaphelidium protococcarum]|nr:hypothetical protein MP228_001932 [Amoeboaphelidium protococcarum]